MATEISNKALLKKCSEFIKGDPASQALDALIKDALITANREISYDVCDTPLGWLRESYNEQFTRVYAEISAITQASPGVITAESLDTDISSDHGYSEDDIIYITGIGGMDRLNQRTYRMTKTAAATLTLNQFHDQTAVNTTSYDEYEAGGHIYHNGVKLDESTIEPSTGTDRLDWKIRRVFDVTFDSIRCFPISEEAVIADSDKWLSPGGRPERWRYVRYGYGSLAQSSLEHFLMFYPPTSGRYNINVHIEKTYPDLSNWTSNTVYPPHPPEVHDYLWHRALSMMSTNAEKQRRESKDGRLMGKIEILYAQHWKEQKLKDEISLRNLNNQMTGNMPSSRGFGA